MVQTILDIGAYFLLLATVVLGALTIKTEILEDGKELPGKKPR